MTIELEPWGGLVVRWPGADLWMLVDWTARESWIVWHGRPIARRAITSC